MTVANNYHKVTYVGNGSTTSFSFDFPIIGDSSIKVYVSIDDTETEVDTSNYSVNVSDNGGNVVFKTAPVKGSVVAIIRLTDQTQETPYKTSSGFPAVRVEEAFDKLTMITQEHQEVLERCVKVVPTNGQKPQELLDEVYARLDSSIEIADSAQKAANEASSAVVRAEGLLEDTTEYVTISKAEIGTLKTETINQVESVSASAIASVTSTSLAAVNSINTAKTTAETNIAKIVSNAEGSIEEIAVEAAQKEVENAANQAVEIASTNINAYIDGTVKPSLSSYVNEAKGYRDNALTYSNNAKTSETKAKTSESNALSYKNSASSSASTATYQANIATTKATESANSATKAANSAELSKLYANDKINQTHITNCITEIPQDIKLEFNNGTLTLKAGSKVYVPNGAGKFDVFITSKNIDIQDYDSVDSSQRVFFITSNNGGGFEFRYLLNDCHSGSVAPTNVSENAIWYDTANNIIKRTSDGGVTWFTNNVCFPICIFTRKKGGGVTSIDQIFNGFGYIGSTVFALPGVKGLIPNGRNEDGSLKNTTISINSVQTITQTGPYKRFLRILADRTLVSTTAIVEYNEEKNENVIGISKQTLVDCGTCEWDASNQIISLQPKLPFRAVDYNDLNDEVKKLELNMPAGSILPFAGLTSPSGFLICDGSAVSRTTYADLFKVIGTTYGTGNGSTTFNLPNYSNARMVTSSTVPVKGNGKALGLTDGTNLRGLAQGSTNQGLIAQESAYNSNVNTNTGSTSAQFPNTLRSIGVTTDSSNSGITGTASLASSCKFIIKY